MKYKLVQRKNLQQPDAAPKWYAARIHTGLISQKDISEDIVMLSSLSRGDVSNVVDSLLDTIPKYLLLGKSINLSGLGTFRLSFSSVGAESPQEFKTNMISRVRVIFRPSAELLTKVKQAKFERVYPDPKPSPTPTLEAREIRSRS